VNATVLVRSSRQSPACGRFVWCSLVLASGSVDTEFDSAEFNFKCINTGPNGVAWLSGAAPQNTRTHEVLETEPCGKLNGKLKRLLWIVLDQVAHDSKGTASI
jgi:hypothetical protein